MTEGKKSFYSLGLFNPNFIKKLKSKKPDIVVKDYNRKMYLLIDISQVFNILCMNLLILKKYCRMSLENNNNIQGGMIKLSP